MSEKIKFQGAMTKFNVNVRKENIMSCFNIQIIEESSIRTLPNQFKRIDLGVFDQIASNDVFTKIYIPCDDYSLKYTMTYDNLEFDVKLESISAVIKTNKTGTPYTVYGLNFEKEIDKDIDLKLASFVKFKEEDPETGKKNLKYFDIEIKEPEEN